MAKRPLYILFLVLAVLTGCHNLPSEVGSGLITSQQFDISFVDTLTLHASTLKYDSLATSNFSGCKSCRLLVGYHDDPKLGPVIVKSAFQLSAPVGATLSPLSTHFTALTLHLIRDTYYYYDTTQTQTISVYRLTKQMQLFNGLLNNVDNFEIDKTSPPLGTITFNPRPHLRDSVEITLSPALGKQLLNMVQQNDETLEADNFAKFFFGLALIPDSLSSRNFIGFKASPVMRLYFHDDTAAPGSNPDKYLSFTLNASNFYFNKFSGDRSATKLAPLKTSTDLVGSAQSDHEIYLQGGTGLAMRIDMPYLKNLSFVQSNFQVTRALLTMQPIKSSFDPQNTIPNTLDVDLVNSVNQTLAAGYSAASLFTDQLGYQTYSIDVTNFVNQEIQTTQSNVGNGLLLRLLNSDWGSTVNRVYLGDQRNPNYFMKLKVYYITLTDQ